MERVRRHLFQGDESNVASVLSLASSPGGQQSTSASGRKKKGGGIGPKEPEINGAAKHGHMPHLFRILLRRGSLNSSFPPIRAGMPASKRAQQLRHSAQAMPAVGATAPSTSAAANSAPISITTRARAESHPESRQSQHRLHQRFPLRLHLNCRVSCKHPPSTTTRNPYPSTARHPPHPPPRHRHLLRPRAAAGSASSGWERILASANASASATPRAAELLALRESGHNTDDFEYDDVRPPGSPPSAYSSGGATARIFDDLYFTKERGRRRRGEGVAG
ncbi:hypothetical protein C8R44DRAFT_987890 [Mycena epipterygia]|nr:hypothetical protein C8R44DRAFT_987890 [Mycena epipterygia]